MWSEDYMDLSAPAYTGYISTYTVYYVYVYYCRLYPDVLHRNL